MANLAAGPGRDNFDFEFLVAGSPVFFAMYSVYKKFEVKSLGVAAHLT